MPHTKFLCQPFLCHPQLWKVYANLFYATFQEGISTFLAQIFIAPLAFFNPTPFYASLKKLEIFRLPPFYATHKILMPPWGWLKKNNGSYTSCGILILSFVGVCSVVCPCFLNEHWGGGPYVLSFSCFSLFATLLFFTQNVLVVATKDKKIVPPHFFGGRGGRGRG